MKRTAEILKSEPTLQAQTSYELITKWLDRGYSTGLSSNAIQLMTMLLRFYNPAKKYVFPHQDTLAERTNTSIATVKRGLNELLKAQLILKIRKQSGNVYAFTGKLFELLNSSNMSYGTAQNELCMIEQIKEQKNHHEDDEKTLSLKKPVSIDDVPESIRKNKKISNPCGYWFSLSESDKKKVIEKEQAEREKKAKVIQLKQAEKNRMQEEQRQIEENRNKPINEQYTYEQAKQMYDNLRKFNQGNSDFAIQLKNAFHLE